MSETDRKPRAKRYTVEQGILHLAEFQTALAVKTESDRLNLVLDSKDKHILSLERYIERLEKRVSKYEDAGATVGERAGKLEAERGYLEKENAALRSDVEKWREKAGDETWLVPLLSFGTNLLEAWKGGRGQAMSASQLVGALIEMGGPELAAQYIAAMEAHLLALPGPVSGEGGA